MPTSQASPAIELLVTDLDNTLWDWFDMWTCSFAPMLDELVRLTEIDRATLESQIRDVHQRRHTSEYSGLLYEVPVLKEFADGLEPKLVFASAIDAFRSGRQNALHAYDGVHGTLRAIRHVGVRVVAYTESQAFYTAMRLRHLKLDDLIDVLYSPSDTDFPDGVSPEEMRTRPDEFYELQHADHRHTPDHILKPDPLVLAAIVDEMAIPKHRVLYVGDSLMKDVAMAQQVGVLDAFAAYGASSQDRPEYQLLQRVSHWRQEDVEREMELRMNPTVSPTYTLQRSFAELLDLFRFGSH